MKLQQEDTQRRKSLSGVRVTPQWAAMAILKNLQYIPTLDPCAGSGALIEATCLRFRGIEKNIAIQPHLSKWIVAGDGLLAPWNGEYIFMNPPQLGVKKWLDKIPEAKAAVVLLRLDATTNKQYANWWKANPPKVIRVLSRPSPFQGTDIRQSDYAWFAWGDVGDHVLLGWI